jgi:poly(3-hydroxybutyrate) depolymerase
MAVVANIDFWIKCNQSNSTASKKTLVASPLEVIQHSYAATAATNSAEVVLIEIRGGGHLWPGRPIPARFKNNPDVSGLLGKTSQNVSANDLIWDFVKRYKLP